MASVVLGRMRGPAGFGKTVAIKRLHPQFAKDPEFVSMFLDEARVTSGLSHTNIVSTLDVLEEPGELLLVMEYVHGAALSTVLKALRDRQETMPSRIAATIMAGALHGLHAAHQATDETGKRLDIVHRDVSPQNILVSTDGAAKIADFGIAKAVGQVHSTSDGVMKGKFSYMAPEQACSEAVTAKTDLYAAGIVLWEMLTSQRLITGTTDAERFLKILALAAPPPSSKIAGLSPAFDVIVARALARKADDRYPSARAMAMALETETELASASEVGAWLQTVVAEPLKAREEMLSEMQRQSVRHLFPSSPDPEDFSRAMAAAASSRDRLHDADATTSAAVSLADLISDAKAPSRAPTNAQRGRRSVVLVAVVLGLVGLGIGVGVTLSSRMPVASVSVAAASAAGAVATPALPEPPASASSTTSAAPSVPSSLPASIESAKPAVTASPPVVTKERATASAAPTSDSANKGKGKGKCEIVVSVDGVGRTQFKEVCAP